MLMLCSNVIEKDEILEMFKVAMDVGCFAYTKHSF